MLVINSCVPLWADDWGRLAYHSNLINVLKNIYASYFNWSGCILPIFFIGLFPLKDAVNINVFNIFNSLFFISLIYSIFFLVYSRKPKNLGDFAVLLLIFALLWFMPVAFGEVILWKMVSSGIMWSLTMTLIFIYQYKKLLENKSKMPDNLISRAIFFITGMLFGTCVQNLVLTISILLVGILGYQKVKKKKIPGWAYTGTGGYVLGTIISIMAPGNYVRVRAARELPYAQLPLLQKIFLLTGQMVVHFLPFVILYLIIFVLRYKFKQKNDCGELRWFYLFLGLALLSAVIMGGAPGALFYGRTTFVSDIFAIVAAVSLIPVDNKKVTKVIWLLLGLIILPLQIYDMVKTYKFYHQLHDQILRRHFLIQAAATYNKNIPVAPIYFSRQINTFNISNSINTNRLFSCDITTDPSQWRNANYYKYYFAERFPNHTIKLVPDLIFSDPISQPIVDTKMPFTVTMYGNKIYYINKSTSCNDVRNKQDFWLKVYPKSWLDNKLYAISESFNLQEKKQQMRFLLAAHKNPAAIFDSKLWFNWQDMKSNFNDFSFTWDGAKRATVLTRDFRSVNNMCVIVDYLPDYSIDHIETGQIKNGRLLWKTIVKPITP